MLELHTNDKISTYQAELNNARIIQQGLLPKKRHFSRIFKEHFALFIPQNIISGDFYWVGERNNHKYLVVGDCTGHGISAALLSIMAINLFEYAIMNKGIKKTNKILKEVDKKFIESFKNSDLTNFDNPWIDLSIICIDEENEKLHYSSANRKMVYFDDKQNMTIHKGSRYPIGGWQLEKKREFESQTINYKKGDSFYLGSDGFQDQLGGESNKKYKSKKLHQLFQTINTKPFSKQKTILEREFFEWKKDQFQVDDVCIVGVQL